VTWRLGGLAGEKKSVCPGRFWLSIKLNFPPSRQDAKKDIKFFSNIFFND
jgi:hypothetical protein